jgi:RNA-directed DNA polymerase
MAIKQRVESCGLELHPKKTKFVFCKCYHRQGNHKTVKFDFLGYSFQPRPTLSKKTGEMFLGYDCAISISSRKQVADKLESMNLQSRAYSNIAELARTLNPKIRGWVNYYVKFRRYELGKVCRLLTIRIIRWVRNRYKRYRTSVNAAYKWLRKVREDYPYLFSHWGVSYAF